MEEHNNLSVLIAMSGGVDSSAAAYLKAIPSTDALMRISMQHI